MLLMKKQFFDAIRTGQKTTTLRYWRRRMVAPGSVHRVRGLGRVQIDSVAEVAAADLTDANAQADGFDTLAQLTETLDTLYPPADRQDRRLYKVSFIFLPGD
jgi:hypothetical protein